jgi:putative membrane protein
MKLALCASAFVLATIAAPVVRAQDAASSTDKEFVGKVSQGGAYEVQASKLALQKAMAQDVKDIAYSETHDHELVGAELKKISAAKQVPIAPKLNAEFQGKLDHLRSLSGADFDTAYLAEMAAIHDKDEKLFAQESMDAGAADYKAFAAKTDQIVKRHIRALHAD